MAKFMIRKSVTTYYAPIFVEAVDEGDAEAQFLLRHIRGNRKGMRLTVVEEHHEPLEISEVGIISRTETA